MMTRYDFQTIIAGAIFQQGGNPNYPLDADWLDEVMNASPYKDHWDDVRGEISRQLLIEVLDAHEQ